MDMRLRSLSLTSMLLLHCVLAAGCRADERSDEGNAEEGVARDLRRPVYTVADLVDDASFRVQNMLVVDFTDGTTRAQFDAWEKDWGVDLELVSEEEGVDSAITVGRVSEISEALLTRIRGNPAVEVVEPLMRLSASFVPNDPEFGRQWNLKQINAPAAWDLSRGKGVTVAVLDTGIAYEDYEGFRQVPDLAGVAFTAGYDFVNGDRHANDDHGHGTHVAGTIAQATDNGTGVAGVAFAASLMPVKVLDHFGSGTSAAIADAIRWAADHGAQVINMSLGGGGRSEVLARAVEYARKKGAVVVCAAGNGGRGTVEFPAAYPGSVAVGAVGPAGVRAPYSSWGKELDLVAPGGDTSNGREGGILQNTIDPRDPAKSVYAAYQGTSMATPHVAGVAALLFAAGARTPSQVERALFSSARPPAGAEGWTAQNGHGLIDAAAALKALRRLDIAQVATGEGGTPLVPEPASAGSSGLSSYRRTNWIPVAWSGGLLALVLLTLGRKERPGFLNVAASPGFLVPLIVSTAGAFFMQWLATPSEVTATLVLPLPDWLNRIIFGRGSTANPLVYSALLPALGAIVAISKRGLRPVVAGFAIGFAALFTYAAWVRAPALAWLPFTFMAIPWLLSNALICLFIARSMLKREVA